MKRLYINSFLLLSIALTLTVSSCKKLTYADISSATDAVNVGFHMNAVIDDATNAVSMTAGLSGSTAMADTVAGGTVDTTQIASGIITITYDGTTIVDSRFKRSGSMTIQLISGAKWIDQNAQLSVYFHNLKFTNIASGHSYTYEGPNTIINTSGGLAYQMLAGVPTATALGAIQYNLRSTGAGDTITFHDDTVRVWDFNRTRTYTNTGGNPEIGVSSSFAINGYTAVDMWGTDHSGDAFYESYITDMIFNNLNCSNNYRDGRGGEAKVYEQQFGIDMVFGAASANAGNIAFNCPYGFKTTYVNSRNNFVEAESQYWY